MINPPPSPEQGLVPPVAVPPFPSPSSVLPARFRPVTPDSLIRTGWLRTLPSEFTCVSLKSLAFRICSCLRHGYACRLGVVHSHIRRARQSATEVFFCFPIPLIHPSLESYSVIHSSEVSTITIRSSPASIGTDIYPQLCSRCSLPHSLLYPIEHF
ncbi:hypothetical protein GQ53DRAFT_200804 [Thozetella sp. PMI_491]|nr:hypothetical protein GQ53DRAFT_200804 [Thozetella sp. PMI_491]